MKIRAIGTLAALALLTGACGSGSDAPADSATTTDDTDSPSDSSATATSNRESPIADLLGVPIGNDEETEQWFAEVQREAEIKTSECMIAQGFEYKPVDLGGGAALAGTDFESREFAEKYGFGISSNPFEEFFAEDSFVDPNEEYVASLSEGEREAYQAALNGEPPDFTSGDEEDLDTFIPGGCQGEAFQEAFSIFSVFEEFGDEFEAIEEAFAADSRVLAAETEWSTCMADVGYTYASSDQAREDFEKRYNEIVSSPDAFEPIDADEAGDGGGFTAFGPTELTPEYQAQVDELAVEERAVGLAAWDCADENRQLLQDIRVEYEQRFVDENGSAIRELLDN